MSRLQEWTDPRMRSVGLKGKKRILTDVWPALKGEGVLINSTCTFNPGENEENDKMADRERGSGECPIKN